MTTKQTDQPISDELLAAFLDGNTSAQETRRVVSALATDDELRQLVSTLLLVDDPESRQRLKKAKKPTATIDTRSKNPL